MRASTFLALFALVGTAPLAVADAAIAPAGARDTLPASVRQPKPADPKPAEPEAKVEAKAELIVLAASNDGSGIDAKIPNQDQLKKPPFSAYNSYRLVEQADLVLAKGKAVERSLPDKGKLSLTLEDFVPKSAKEEARYVVAASIVKADGEKFLPRVQLNSKKGEWFFVAGQKFKDGILVLGFRVI